MGRGRLSQALLDAINAAAAADIVFVAAAGNSGANNDVTPHYPSSYNAPNIIAVMATDHNDARSIWPSGNSSSFGATSVDIAAPGFNYRLADVLCALGIPQLERLESLLAARERVAGWYGERLEHLVGTPAADEGDRHGWQAYVVSLDRRDEALAGLRESGIEAQIGTYALHRLSAYRDRGSFPGADAAFDYYNPGSGCSSPQNNPLAALTNTSLTVRRLDDRPARDGG